MVAYDLFRRDLAAMLLERADRHRDACAGRSSTDAEAKAATLLEDLAVDARNLDLHVYLLFQLMLTHDHLARRYYGGRAAMLDQVGMTCHPATATDLVRWMTRRSIAADDGRDPIRGGLGRPPGLPRPPTIAGAAVARTTARSPGARPAVAVACDFAAGMGIVAPILSLWEVGLGVDQWRDRAWSRTHAAVPASVVSSQAAEVGRSPTLSSTLVMTFRPSSSATPCRVAMRVDLRTVRPEPGATVPVVPRSPACEPPLLAAGIGDPVGTFVLAAALMVGGLASLGLWRRLSAPRPRHPIRADWS